MQKPIESVQIKMVIIYYNKTFVVAWLEIDLEGTTKSRLEAYYWDISYAHDTFDHSGILRGRHNNCVYTPKGPLCYRNRNAFKIWEDRRKYMEPNPTIQSPTNICQYAMHLACTIRQIYISIYRHPWTWLIQRRISHHPMIYSSCAHVMKHACLLV